MYNHRGVLVGVLLEKTLFSSYFGGPPSVPTWFLSNGNPTLSLIPTSLCKMGAPGFGLLIIPMKMGAWVVSSTRAKKNGWMRWKTGLDAREMTTVVAAVASAPSSFISMLDLCITLDTIRGPSAMLARLGLENTSPRPDPSQRKRRVNHHSIPAMGVSLCEFSTQSVPT